MNEVSETALRPRPPVPSGLSLEAQDYLASIPAFFGEATCPTDPSDVEGWLAYVDAVNAASLAIYAARVPTDSPPLVRGEFELEGVRTYVLRPPHVTDGPETPIF